MVKTFMMMAVFGIGFASVAAAQASEVTPHAVRIASAQQEQQITFPVSDDSKQGETVHSSNQT